MAPSVGGHSGGGAATLIESDCKGERPGDRLASQISSLGCVFDASTLLASSKVQYEMPTLKPGKDARMKATVQYSHPEPLELDRVSLWTRDVCTDSATHADGKAATQTMALG